MIVTLKGLSSSRRSGYKIDKINTAIGNNPNYVKLQALEGLKAISKDPASKIYFMNGDSPSPPPLMSIGINK